MIHESLPTFTETAVGSHPCCVVSVTYVRTHCFHGGNAGSNPIGDGPLSRRFLAFFRRTRQLRARRDTAKTGATAAAKGLAQKPREGE
jgi:hypothetical protein